MWLLHLLVLLCCLSRSAAIRAPKEVSGLVGGQLTVTCNYEAECKRSRKCWCRGKARSSCKMLVETTGTEQVVKKGHMTIRDNQREHRFIVTMEKLRLDDMDVYWCGIKKPGVDDLWVSIKVSIDPALTIMTTTTTTLTITAMTTTTTTTIMTTTTRASTEAATPEKTTHSSSVTAAPSSTKSHLVLILLSISLALLPLSLLLAVLLVWRKLKTQKTAAGISPKLDTQEEEEVCYAHLTLRPCATKPTNANITPQNLPRASRNPEVATEYSSIRRLKARL